ncbi:MAG: Tad domain-containing protein [Pseudobdellovibrio sp.]
MKIPRFKLSRKKQKGQVAIFVALIFQVLFVFFALLINVGLLVHHKINLQQSVDLAAYYGAMKQAESLNAMAHINYQIRQSWKLLTWRYRVLGTFGFQKDGSSSLKFPVTLQTNIDSAITSAPGNNPVDKCQIGADLVNTADIPFFCIGHVGMKGWPGLNESNCRLNCQQLNNQAAQINRIPGISTISGAAVSYQIQALVNMANDNVKAQCEALGPKNMDLLGGFIAGYYFEQEARSKTLLMLAANISKEVPEEILDLDGNLVFDGVKNTLKNNLTEANSSSISNSKIKIINGLSIDGCRMAPDLTNAGLKKTSNQFLKRIEFQFVQLFAHACSWTGLSANYLPKSIFDSSNSSGMTQDFKVSPDVSNLIMTLESKDNQKFTVGYEKNPWCQSYYGVRAETEPKIPFLPLSKIKLSAVAVAKPFGGSIGPWFGKEWKSNSPNSQNDVGVDSLKQTDMNLPLIEINSAATSMKDSIKTTLNFSKYVGDQEGLASWDYLGEYHAALINRKPTELGITGMGSVNKNPDPYPGNQKLSKPGQWPALDSWKDTYDMTSTNYDPLTKDGNNDTNLRDLEISAIAPNQFDLTYYSIDPDFYNNYYTRLSNPAIFNKLKSSAGYGPDNVNQVRPDFGNNERVYAQKKSFSVRNQIEIVKKIFKGKSTGLSNSNFDFLAVYPELATKQSSLLTGWTFLNFTDFNTFPGVDKVPPESTMSFGRCNGEDDKKWQGTDANPEYGTPSEVSADLPPTPGNCVTGGRVGYSVKLVSPSMLRATAAPQPLGGVGTSGKIINPIPDSFLNF